MFLKILTILNLIILVLVVLILLNQPPTRIEENYVNFSASSMDVFVDKDGHFHAVAFMKKEDDGGEK